MSAWTTCFTRASGYSARRGVVFQLQPIMTLANRHLFHAMRTKSFASGVLNRRSMTEQLRENAPLYSVIIAIMTASALGGSYVVKKNALLGKHVELAEERAKNEIALVEERAKTEAALAIKEIALVVERAKKETALVEERAKKEIALAKAETTLVKERAQNETALWKERTEKMIANAKVETAETFLRYGCAAEFFEYQKKIKLGDHGKAESDEKE